MLATCHMCYSIYCIYSITFCRKVYFLRLGSRINQREYLRLDSCWFVVSRWSVGLVTWTTRPVFLFSFFTFCSLFSLMIAIPRMAAAAALQMVTNSGNRRVRSIASNAFNTVGGQTTTHGFM